MKKTLFLITILFLISSSFALATSGDLYFVDNFEDNELSNPPWTLSGSFVITANGFMEGSREGYTGSGTGYSYAVMNRSGNGYYNMSFIVRKPTAATERTWTFAYTGATPSINHGAICWQGDGAYSCHNATTIITLATIGSDSNQRINLLLNGSTGDFEVFINGTSYGIFANRGTMTNGYTGIAIIEDLSGEDGYVDDITVTNATALPILLSITNSTLNMTSDGGCTVWRTDKTSQCNTTDGTPTTVVDTNKNAFCSVRTSSHTYSGSFNCSTTGGTSHICTIFNSEKLASGTADLFISCNNTANDESDTSGAMRINMTAGTGGVTINNFTIIGDGCGATIDGAGLVVIA